MSRAKKILQSFDEKGIQFRTKIKQVESNHGSRHIRNQVENAITKSNNMLNAKHVSPNPQSEADTKILNEAIDHLKEAKHKLKKMKDSRKKRK